MTLADGVLKKRNTKYCKYSDKIVVLAMLYSLISPYIFFNMLAIHNMEVLYGSNASTLEMNSQGMEPI